MSASVQLLLDHLQAGEDAARDALLEHCAERFRLLARRMLRQKPYLRLTGDDSGDVLQKALVRLHKALALKPATPRAYFALAAQHVRWVLRDLARQLARDNARGVNGIPLPGDGPPDAEGEPADLLQWTEFHEAIDRLPDDEREAFDLLFYQGMSQDEAAGLLGISVRTLKRRWQGAKLLLHASLRGEWPNVR